MRSIPYFALVAFIAACEGEPPKTPAVAVVAPAPEQAVEPEGSPQAAAASAPSGAPAPAGTCACCPCTSGATDAGAGEGGGAVETAAAAPTAPATATTTISGSITTMPKPMAANAVVYLEDAPVEPTAKMTAWVDNKNMTFIPFVTVIPAGGRVTFHNSDPFPHNVFSPDADKFNIGTVSQNQALVNAFKKPGAYSLLCNLHPGMLGYLVVAPSSYFAKADGKGHYALKNVPAGTYKVTAWAPRQQPTTQSVTVKGGDATLDFELHR